MGLKQKKISDLRKHTFFSLFPTVNTKKCYKGSRVSGDLNWYDWRQSVAYNGGYVATLLSEG